MDKIRLGLQFCDGIEAANAGNEPLDDARAYRYGKEFGLVMTAGSDNHWSPYSPVYGVELDEKLDTIDDYVRTILDRKPIRLHVPGNRFAAGPAGVPDERHRAWMLDDREQDIPAGREWMD